MLKHQLESGKRLRRVIFKRFLYSFLALRSAVLILLGKEHGAIEFTVAADPPSVYFNFRVKADRLEDFIRHLALPQGFELCPIRCINGEQADYLLTLNVYLVTGIANGVRAEWSTYIRDQDGIPRYMVVEARDNDGSLDPINIFTRPTQVEQALGDDGFTSIVESANKRCFRAKSSKAAITEARVVQLHPEWIEANDFIYWRNGICDHVYYNARLANAKVKAVELTRMEITDDTEWAAFLEPQAKHIVVLESAIGFMINPWVNL